MRLRTALLVLLGLIGLVLAGTVYAGFALHKGDIVAQERQNLEVTADAVAENLGTRLAEKRKTVTWVAREPAAARHEGPAQSALVERFVTGTQFDGASVVAANGTMVAIRADNLSEQGRADLRGADFSHRPYVRRGLAGETSIGDPFRAESGNLVVAVSAPIAGENGTVRGVFTGTFHVGHSQVLAGVSDMHGPEEHLEITDGAGQLLYATGEGAPAGDADQGTARSDGSETDGSDGGESGLSATTSVEEGGWTLRLAQAPATLEDRLWKATATQVGAVVLAISLIGLVALGVYRSTVRHLESLADGLDRLEAGQYDQEIQLGVTDEWARISSQFNALADTLSQRESQLRVLNRVLRHNLRNDMSVVVAHAENLLHDGDEPAEEEIRTIRRTAYNLIETSEHARAIYQTLLGGENHERAPVDLTAVVEREAAHLREAFPRSTIETDLPAEAWVLDSDAVPIVVDEVGRNALLHNDRPEAERSVHVAVETAPDADEVVLVVADNGPGLPDFEAELLTGAREETSVDHGSGLGLWVVNWLVEEVDGEIAIESGDERGTTVRVRLPAASPPATVTSDGDAA